MNKKSRRNLIAAALVGVLAITPQLSRAQEGAWQYGLTPYLWAMGLDGDVGAHGVTAPVDVKFLDALKDLDLAGMLAGEASNGKCSLLMDATYVKLSDDTDTALGNLSAEVEQWSAQGAAVYRVAKTVKTTVDVGVGGRYYDVHTQIDGPYRDASDHKGWADPLLVMRVRQQLTEDFFGQLVGDIGGFGVSSDLTWQLTAAAGYKLSPYADLLLGYRYLDYDYSKDGFVYDMATSGLALGVNFRF